MTDKTALQGQQRHATIQDNNNPRTTLGDTENVVGESLPDSRQISFDARFTILTDGFGQACEQEGVQTAIAIAIHPDEKHPIVFVRGHQYDASVILAEVLRHFTRDLLGPLNPSPNYEPEGNDER